MLNEFRVRNNENLLRNIFKYNNVKDLSTNCQVSKSFIKSSNKFQNYWREEMNKIFSSDFPHYNLTLPQNLSETHITQDYFDWKGLMKRAYHIKNNWDIDESCLNKDFLNDLRIIKNEIYSSLKNYVGISKLREKNLYVENELNSPLQIYLLDTIFETQDFYDYFDLNQITNSKIEVKNKDLPFACILENYDKEHIKSINNFISINSLRWYDYEYFLDYNEDYNSDNIAFIAKSLIQTIHNFCQFTYSYILEYENEDLAFLNEYSKRYRSFIDFATHFNDLLENFNVLTNYTFINLFDLDYQPKFSVLRLFVRIWEKEVLRKLEKEDSRITNKLTNLLMDYLNNENTNLTIQKEAEENSNNKIITEHLIGQFNKHLLDMSCNEFNVFYLNYSEIKLDNGYYQKWENEVIRIIDENLNLGKIPINISILAMFIPKTETKIIKKILSISIEKLSLENLINFKAFSLINSQIKQSEAEEHLKENLDLVEINEEIILKLLMTDNPSEDRNLEKYKSILFINKCKKDKNLPFLYLIELTELKIDNEYKNNRILKENIRRNIYLNLLNINQQLYRITEEVSSENLLELNIRVGNANKDLIIEKYFFNSIGCYLLSIDENSDL